MTNLTSIGQQVQSMQRSMQMLSYTIADMKNKIAANPSTDSDNNSDQGNETSKTISLIQDQHLTLQQRLKHVEDKLNSIEDLIDKKIQLEFKKIMESEISTVAADVATTSTTDTEATVPAAPAKKSVAKKK